MYHGHVIGVYAYMYICMYTCVYTRVYYSTLDSIKLQLAIISTTHVVNYHEAWSLSIKLQVCITAANR